MSIGGWVFIGVVVALAIWVIAIYNNLVALRNRFKNAFAQIDVQLKRRYDLIPNLVETAKGYMAHERQTLEAVIAARNSAQSATQKAAANPADAAADFLKDVDVPKGATSWDPTDYQNQYKKLWHVS